MDKTGFTLNSTYTMPSYSLRSAVDVRHFIDILNQLLDIYEHDAPKFFQGCVQKVEISMYEKIVELNGSKRRSKHWSKAYMECIDLSKQVIVAISTVEDRESQRYLTSLHSYEHYFGTIPRRTYKVSSTAVPEFDD